MPAPVRRQGAIVQAELHLPFTPSSHLQAQAVNQLNQVPAMVKFCS